MRKDCSIKKKQKNGGKINILKFIKIKERLNRIQFFFFLKNRCWLVNMCRLVTSIRSNFIQLRCILQKSSMLHLNTQIFRYKYPGCNKILIARKSRKIFQNMKICDSNEIWTHNHLVCKGTINHLAKLVKWLSCVVSTYLHNAFDCMLLSCHKRLWVQILLLSLKLQMWRLLRARSSLTFRQL